MKVLYFDYWTKGLPHQILPLDKILINRDIDRILIHLGSWRDKAVKEEEIIDSLLCKDIKFYYNDIRKAFVAENPQVVYVLNMGGPIDKLVNRICRNLRIKTIFLMHGTIPIGSDLVQERKKINKGLNTLYRLSKAFKYFKVYQMYIREILLTGYLEFLRPKTYGHLFQMLFSPGSMYTTPFVDRDLHTDRVLVYSKLYKEEFVINMHVPIGKISIVGNPNLDSIIQLGDDNIKNRLAKEGWSKSFGISFNKPILIYLADGLNYFGEEFTKHDWLSELQDVAQLADELRWTLIIKLHPSNNRKEVTDYLKSMHNVHIFQMEVDLSIVASCKAAVGHISTALTVPIALNVPVFIPRWTKVYANFDYYISNGAAIPCNSIQELRDYLGSIELGKKIEAGERTICIEDSIGPLDGFAWERIAKEIETLCLEY